MPYIQKSPEIWCWECHLCQWQTSGHCAENPRGMVHWVQEEKSRHIDLHQLASSSLASPATELPK